MKNENWKRQGNNLILILENSKLTIIIESVERNCEKNAKYRVIINGKILETTTLLRNAKNTALKYADFYKNF